VPSTWFLATLGADTSASHLQFAFGVLGVVAGLFAIGVGLSPTFGGGPKPKVAVVGIMIAVAGLFAAQLAGAH